jgi:hypothetical protein
MKKEINQGFLLGCAGIGALALGLAASPVWAGEPAPPSTTTQVTGGGMPSRTETTHATVVVTAIDHLARSFTVKMAGGGKTELQATPDMKEFDKLKVGDKIDVSYSESLVLGMLPKGTKPSMSASGASIPGAAGQQMSVSAEIVNVDTVHNKVTFKGPKGKIRTVAVQSPDLQSRLPSLKPGDVLVFQYTEAVVTAIQPVAK